MEPGTTEQFVDLAMYVALLGLLVSPPVLNLVKNLGKWWSDRTKTVVALGFAVVGSVVAYAAATDISALSLTDWQGFWLPFIFGVAAMVGVQYASFKTLWADNGALGWAGNALAAIGQPKNPGE